MGIRIQGSNDTILATDGSWNAEGIDPSAGLNVGTAVTVSARGDIAITGIITASSFSGVDSDKISENNTQVETVDTGSDGHITFDTDGTEAARFDPSQRLLIGHTSSVGKDRQVQLVGTSADASTYMAFRHVDSGDGPRFELVKSRSGSAGSFTIVQSGDGLGSIDWLGDDGVDTQSQAAAIACEVDGTPGGNDMPGRLLFKTTADSAASPTERLRIDSSGRILQGSSTGRNTALMAAQPTYQLEGTSSNTSNFGVFCNSNGSAAGGLIFGKTRGGAVGGTTVVQSGDSLGHISFEGSDGSAQRVGARITTAVDGTPGSSDMPGRLMFFTTPDGSATEVERLRIDSSGHTLPGADNTYDLGSYSKRWANVHSMDLNLSNEGSQNDVDGSWGSYTIQEGENDLFLLNRRNGKKYKFNLTEV